MGSQNLEEVQQRHPTQAPPFCRDRDFAEIVILLRDPGYLAGLIHFEVCIQRLSPAMHD